MSDPGTILVTSRSFGSGTLDLTHRIEAAGYRVVRGPADHDLTQLGDVLPSVVGWIAGVGPLTEHHLAEAPRLRVVARYGTGVDAVDREAANEHGVIVTNTPGANSTAVAEHTIALLLAALRGIPRADRSVRQDNWTGWRTRELAALTVGIVGLGQIGRKVARLLSHFGATVAGSDPFLDPGDAVFRHVRPMDVETMATDCDVISLHAPGGGLLLDERWMRVAPRPVIIVNTARADLVDEGAVVSAIRSGRVRAYAADTCAGEGGEKSLLLDPELADAVTITPHLAAQTHESIDTMGAMAVENLLSVLAGEIPPNPVA